jgi:toxin FitB
MYLIDTNVISELRKQKNANLGVKSFFMELSSNKIYLSCITIGEIRRGIDLMTHRGDILQAEALENWLSELLQEYKNRIVIFEQEAAQLWGKLRAPRHENAIDKQIAAIALIHDLTLVTRNTADFLNTGVKLINPFTD